MYGDMANSGMEHSDDFPRPRRVTVSHSNEDVSKVGIESGWFSQFTDLFHKEFIRSHSGLPATTASVSTNGEPAVPFSSNWSIHGTPIMVFFLFILTALSKVLNDWAETHFLSGPKGQPYFFKMWAKSLIIVVLLQFILRNFSVPLKNRMRAAQSKLFLLWPLMLLHVLVTVIFSFDFIKNTKNAAGSEFYQVNIVLNLLVLAAGLHISSYMKIPNHVHITLIVISGLQLMILAQDDYFHMSFTVSLYTILVVASMSCYVLLLLADLRKASILELVYYLNLCLVVALPFPMIFSDVFPGFNETNFSFDAICLGLFRICLLATVTLFHMVVSCLFIKVTDPLACTVAWNLSWVIHTLLMALVYKKIYHVSSFKISWFLIIHVFLIFGPFCRDIV